MNNELVLSSVLKDKVTYILACRHAKFRHIMTTVTLTGALVSTIAYTLMDSRYSRVITLTVVLVDIAFIVAYCHSLNYLKFVVNFADGWATAKIQGPKRILVTSRGKSYLFRVYVDDGVEEDGTAKVEFYTRSVYMREELYERYFK